MHYCIPPSNLLGLSATRYKRMAESVTGCSLGIAPGTKVTNLIVLHCTPQRPRGYPLPLNRDRCQVNHLGIRSLDIYVIAPPDCLALRVPPLGLLSSLALVK